MSTPTRLSAYAAGLVVAFALAFGVGRLVGPLDVGTSDSGSGSEHGRGMVP